VKTKPIILREQADRDIEDAVRYYATEASEQVALAFVDSLERAFEHISRRPATGSPRFAHELSLSGLRSWTLARYPFLVFYLERADHIDVWRVLDNHRDIPAWMRDPDAV
jgi:toxin ParE1/3/4